MERPGPLRALVPIHPRVTARTLGVVRAGVFLIWIVKLVPEPLSFFAELPQSMLVPHGVMHLVPSGAWPTILTPDFLTGFKLVLLAVLALGMIGIRPYRPIALAAAGLLTFHEGLVRGFTIVNHQELAPLYCVFILAIFPAADGFSWPRRKAEDVAAPAYSAALRWMTCILVIAYTAIAAYRLAWSAPGIFLGDSIPHWIASLSGLQSDGWQLGGWILRHPALVTVAKAVFIVTTTFELLAPLCLFCPRFRRLWIAILVPFHILSSVTLNIFFWENVLLILLLLTDIDTIVTRVADAVASRRSARPRISSA